MRSTDFRLLLANTQSAFDTPATLTAAADAILIAGDPTWGITHKSITRNVQQGYQRGPESVVYARDGAPSFSVECQGSGTAGTAPKFGRLLKACGMAEAVTASTLVEYTMVAGSATSYLTMKAQDDGLFKDLKNAVGSVKGGFVVEQIPTLDFSFMGEVTGVSAGSNLTGADFAAFKLPDGVGAVNSNSLVIGGAYAAGAITGGTVIPYRSFTWDLGYDVSSYELASLKDTSILGRNPTFEITIAATASQSAGYYADILANTYQSLGAIHGKTAGKICGVFGVAAKFGDVEETSDGKRLLVKIKGEFTPTTANNEFRLFFK